jgi:hypothetical protein
MPELIQISEEIKQKCRDKMDLLRSWITKRSSKIAEEEHHKSCEYECCGSHDDFQDFEKCPVCGMTEEIQDSHNDDWWQAVDEIEGNDDACTRYQEAITALEKFIWEEE